MIWDVLRAELADTVRSSQYAKPLRECLYCGAKTRALSQVCTAHSDLPKIDPHLNIGAAKFQKATASYPATCPACRGTGGGTYNDCPTCDGNGVV